MNSAAKCASRNCFPTVESRLNLLYTIDPFRNVGRLNFETCRSKKIFDAAGGPRHWAARGGGHQEGGRRHHQAAGQGHGL